MKYVFLSDFDGTITKDDTLDYIADHVFDRATRQQWETGLINGSLSYKSYLKHFDKICFNTNTLPDTIVDPGFQSFYEKYGDNLYIVSKGVHEIVRRLLPFVDVSHIMAHKVDIDMKNIWHVGDNLDLIDKKKIISGMRDKYDYIVFIGDGISDFEVVGNVDLLFVKANSHLHKFIMEQHPSQEATNYILFNTFKDIITETTNYNFS
jgi:2-hydroxy-3-keto-5-methylthiopentenyl-1-phosphate phosphatase